MRTTIIKIQGDQVAVWAALWLATRSQWFSFDPLPDCEYEITVKEEFAILFRTALRVASEMPREELFDEMNDLVDIADLV